jgi:uncharacterized repeat protein (TIGR01451 family)
MLRSTYDRMCARLLVVRWLADNQPDNRAGCRPSNYRIANALFLGAFTVIVAGAAQAFTLLPATSSPPPVHSGVGVLAPDCPPVLVAHKSATLSTDADHDGAVSPGDVLLYTITIENVGGSIATNVVFSDTLDPKTDLMNGTVQTNQGTVLIGNHPGDRDVFVDIGELLVGPENTVVISFQATITNPFPPGPLTVINQGIVSSTEVLTVTTETGTVDPGPTTVIVTATPQLRFSPVAPQCLSPGTSFNITWTITNEGNGAFNGGTLTTTTSDNSSGETHQAVGVIPGQSSLALVQSLTVTQPLAYGDETVTGTAQLFNTSTLLNLHVCAPDLRASSATVTTTHIFAHEMLTYTWHLRNTGDGNALGAHAIFTPANVPLYHFVDIIGTSEGQATWIPAKGRVEWHGDLLSGDDVTVTFRTASVFGLPHIELASPFEVTHAWRPPYYGLVNYPYPYKLFIMRVLNDAGLAR